MFQPRSKQTTFPCLRLLGSFTLLLPAYDKDPTDTARKDEKAFIFTAFPHLKVSQNTPVRTVPKEAYYALLRQSVKPRSVDVLDCVGRRDNTSFSPTHTEVKRT